jgi:small subunit ribosomal protein S6
VADNLIDLNAKTKRQRHYETIFILSPALTETVLKQIAERSAKILTDTKAASLRQDDWGKKRMAYSIAKHAMGHYFYFRYIGTQETVAALERSLKLDANVLRFMTVKLSEQPLTQEQVDTLVERAPREVSSVPSARGDDEDFGYDASYN